MKFTVRICNATPHRNKAILLFDDGYYAEGFVFSHNMEKSNNTYHQLRKNPSIGDDRNTYLSHQLRRGKIGEKELFGVKIFLEYVFDPMDLYDIQLIYLAKKEGKPWNEYLKQEKLKLKKACHTVESKIATTTIRDKARRNIKSNKHVKHKMKK